MLNSLPMSSVIDSMIPISRFNKGEANKIFDEVASSGYKIVVKNNKPACILIDPLEYKKMIEIIEDYKLATLAEQRMSNSKNSNWISDEDVWKEFNITENDLDLAEDVEIE
ncbi:MAG: hypothetical protein ACRC6K_00520 [Fusobacteriaceae bacterium]